MRWEIKTALWHVREALYTLGWLRPHRPEYATFLRLLRANARCAPRRPGRFAFPFGAIRYVDFEAMLHQYDEIFLQRAYDFVADTDTPFILDGGSHIGLSVIRFKLLYPKAHVIAFEADPFIAEVLQHNLSSLRLQSVEVIQAALWIENTCVAFEPDGADGGRIHSAGPSRVPAVRLADYIQRPVDLLKLDIEGAEFDVLLDLCGTGRIDFVRRLICELHVRSESHRRVGQVLLALAQRGFRLSFGKGAAAPQMPGHSEPTPFPALPDGKSLLLLYAWKDTPISG